MTYREEQLIVKRIEKLEEKIKEQDEILNKIKIDIEYLENPLMGT